MILQSIETPVWRLISKHPKQKASNFRNLTKTFHDYYGKANDSIDISEGLALAKSMLGRFIYKLLRYYWRVRKPIVLGAQTMVLQGNKVLLVRLTYTHGWHLPGGGLKQKESFRAAALRELREECGLEAKSLKLFHLYHSTRTGKIDHIAVFTTNDFESVTSHVKDREIAEQRFFALDELPKDLIGAASRRLLEYRGLKPVEDQW